MKQLNKFIYLTLILTTIIGLRPIWANAAILSKLNDTTKKTKAAPAKKEKEEDPGEVSTVLISGTSNAIFNAKADYVFEVKNTTANDQVGKVTYLVMTETGTQLKEDSVKVSIPKKSTKKFPFIVYDGKPGFYKLNFMINVTDYDDTTRKAFGIRPEELRSAHKKPADFETFWQTAKSDLAKVSPNFKITYMPKLNTPNRYVYSFQMQSLGNMTIQGWLTEPKTVDKGKKFAVLVGLPGYQVALKEMTGMDEDLAIITLNVRGQGNSRGPIATRRDEFIFYHINDKDKYVMRGVIMDCVRCIDFIFSRKELKHNQILVSGGSMGGFLAIATAALDKRVALCSSQNPIMCDVRNLVGEVDWPLNDIYKYIAIEPGLTLGKVFDVMDYFDTKNFASDLTCPTLIGIGLVDPIAPPPNEYIAFNSIPASTKKTIMAFKDLGHEVPVVYKDREGRWMRDEFALF